MYHWYLFLSQDINLTQNFRMYTVFRTNKKIQWLLPLNEKDIDKCLALMVYLYNE